MRSPLVHRGGAIVAAGIGLLAAAAPAGAAPPSPEDFEVSYWATGPGGEKSRLLGSSDRRYFVNQARCECGEAIGVTVAMKPNSQLDPATPIEVLVGPSCAKAEGDPEDTWQPCVRLARTTAGALLGDLEASFHPVWLGSGVAPESPTREASDPQAIAARACAPTEAEGGVSLCADINGIAGCQAEEIFYGPETEAVAEQAGLRIDFRAPSAGPESARAERTSAGVRVSWSTEVPGDIFGYRVLCERADTGEPVAALTRDPPAPDAPLTGNFYVAASDLCPDGPVSAVIMAGAPAGAGGCGDGFVDDGEECDDGEDNADDGLCSSACALNVSAGLHALGWAHVCSEHLGFNASFAEIEGLERGEVYNFVLVSYDRAGNPRAFSKVMQVSLGSGADAPEPPAVGCGCRSTEAGGPFASLLAALGLLGARRRRRA